MKNENVFKKTFWKLEGILNDLDAIYDLFDSELNEHYVDYGYNFEETQETLEMLNKIREQIEDAQSKISNLY